MLLKQIFKGDSQAAFCHFLYDVSAHNLFHYNEIRVDAKPTIYCYVNETCVSQDDMFRGLDDLEFCLRDCDGMLHVARETPGWNVRCCVA